MAVHWKAVSCSLAYIHRRFRGSYRLHHQGRKAGAKIKLWEELGQSLFREHQEEHHYFVRGLQGFARSSF
jgi:hypothetical protein